MKDRVFKIVWPIFSAIVLGLGVLLVLYFANAEGTDYTVDAVIGLLFSFLLAPAFHEIGHIAFGFLMDMQFVYVKFFCFEIKKTNGELDPSIVSPFLPDQTQMMPKKSGNMQLRATFYTLGGLLFSGVILAFVILFATYLSSFHDGNYLLWGLVPYMVYLFLLNIAPVEYDSGKTDMRIYFGIQNKEDAEMTMLSAMEIQGRLNEDKSFTEIEGKWFFNIPQLPEDEPLFAVMLDLRYRYYLEKGDLRSAADCLNRLAGAQEYLPKEELKKIAAEFVYMHSVKGNIDMAKESEKSCGDYLKTSETATKLRIVCAYKKAQGLDEEVKELLLKSKEILKKENVPGLAKHEKILLERV